MANKIVRHTETRRDETKREIRTAWTVQRVKRSKIGLIVNGSRIQIQVFDAVL